MIREHLAGIEHTLKRLKEPKEHTLKCIENTDHSYGRFGWVKVRFRRVRTNIFCLVRLYRGPKNCAYKTLHRYEAPQNFAWPNL